MKKIYTLLVLVAFSVAAFAQNTVTPEQIVSKEKVDVPYKMTKAVDDTLGIDEWFNVGQPVIFSAGAGHVNGTYWTNGSPGQSNGSCVGHINFGRYAVEEVLAWCGSKDYAAGGGTSTITASVYLMDDSTSYQDGSGNPIYEGPAPGTQVGGSGSITVSNIDTTSAGANGFVVFTLSSPAEIGPNDGDWAVVLDWSDCYTNSDTVGFVMSGDNPSVTYTFNDYVLQYYTPGGLEWVRFSDAWQSWTDNIPGHWAVVDTKVGMPETFDNNGVKLYQNVPNPSRGNTKISYEVDENTHVAFEVINSVGKTVYFEEGMKTANTTYNVTFNEGDLAPGVYYYSMVTHGNRLTMKMIIAE